MIAGGLPQMEAPALARVHTPHLWAPPHAQHQLSHTEVARRIRRRAATRTPGPTRESY